MKSEDTRNLFLAIALSVLVMAAWQYFYAGPLYQREHQAQMQATNQASQANPASPTEAQPTRRRDSFAAGRAGRRHAARRPGCGDARDGQRGPGGQPAGDHRYAERRRLDQP